MRSNRCKGRNLINHCQQKNIPQNISIKYNYDKKSYDKEWECVLSFLDSDCNYISFASSNKTKYDALNSVFVLSEDTLLENLDTFKLNGNKSGK